MNRELDFAIFVGSGGTMVSWICFVVAIWIFTCVKALIDRDKDYRKDNPLDIANDVDLQFDRTLIRQYLEHKHLTSELEKDIFDSVKKLDVVEIMRQKRYILEWKIRFDTGIILSTRTYRLNQAMIALAAITLIVTGIEFLKDKTNNWSIWGLLIFLGIMFFVIELGLFCFGKINVRWYSQITAFINIYESYLDDRLIQCAHSDD